MPAKAGIQSLKRLFTVLSNLAFDKKFFLYTLRVSVVKNSDTFSETLPAEYPAKDNHPGPSPASVDPGR